MRKNKTNKRFIYLISPNKIISNQFYIDLKKILDSKKIRFFKLRLKNETNKNKLSIRKYLQENHNYNSIAPKKEIFEPTFLPLSLDFKQRELSKKMGIKIENLNKRQFNDLYFWSKYIVNNKLEHLF